MYRLRDKTKVYTDKHVIQTNDIINGLNYFSSVIPFRESKLTRILQSSLGGNAKTCVICTMTPVAIDESHSTLRVNKRKFITSTLSKKVAVAKWEYLKNYFFGFLVGIPQG